LPARELLAEFERLAPDVFKPSSEALIGASRDLDFCRPVGAAFAGCPSIFLDYTILEKTDRAVVVHFGGTLAAGRHYGTSGRGHH
jgi:mannose-1-phosphate guanylyltransferase